MIKFFRNIRQNLLMEHKTSKYFKYAIGEIVLVVIGILIALQINNWNEGRKDEKRAKELIEKLKVEISEIVNYLKYSNEGIEHQLSYLQKVLNSNETNIDTIITKTQYNLSPILLIKDKKLTRKLQLFHKSVKTRLDEFIEEEYKQAREINDYISATYASLFEDEPVTLEFNWNENVTKNLILKLKNERTRFNF